MRTAVRSLSVLAAVCALAFTAAHVRAQDDDEGNQEEIQKISAPFQEAMEALQAKDYDKAIKAFDQFFPKLEKAKLSDEIKKNAECNARYNYACALSLTGKKPEAVKAFARSVELGFWDWKHIDEDTDLDAIRKEDGFKKAIDDGKVAEKAKQEKDAKKAFDDAKAALAKDPLFKFDFEVKTIDGKTLKLSDLKGKVVIVDVWGTWCPPCRMEIPHFVKLYDQYKEKGLEIVGLACEQDQDEAAKLVKEFAEKNGVKYALAPIDQDSDILKQIPDFKAFPTTLFIDKDGKVRVKEVGYRDYAPLEGTVKALLEGGKADAPKGDGK